MASGSGVTRRGVIGGSVGLAAGAALGVSPNLTLAQAPAAMPDLPRGREPEPASVVPAEAAVAIHADAILRIRREVWDLAEVSLAEVRSFRVHLRELEAVGFRTASTATSGYPTAFVSEWSQGSGGPVIAYLPEYDALPGLGNRPEARQAPPTSGIMDGHGCGHDMLGAGCTGAALALKSIMEAEGLSGTIRVFGCAAEETQGAKVYFVRDGLFEDVDIALAWHPAPFAATGEIATAANAKIRVSFKGRTAHAGLSPWEGRSALKGAELFTTGLQFMREHVLPTTRIHYIYEEAGVAPNIVPDQARILLTLRGASVTDVKEVIDWARDICAGAALMTQTEGTFNLFFGVNDIMPNTPLVGLTQRHMEARPPVWTDEEQTFARAVQHGMGLAETGLATSVLPALGPTPVGGSSDLGDVSKVVPLGVFAWPTVGLGTALHTWGVTACGGSSIGDRASLDSARILAGIGYDVMTDAGLRAEARADLERRLETAPSVPLLPADQEGPVGIPDWV